jgi:hypothetical protein
MTSATGLSSAAALGNGPLMQSMNKEMHVIGEEI